MLNRIVTFRAGKTVEDIATSVDFRDAHLSRELRALLFVAPYIVEELPKQSLTFGDNTVVSEQIFRIIRGEDLRRCSETKIQTIPSSASSETILHRCLQPPPLKSSTDHYWSVARGVVLRDYHH